jgi:hypothetical protein
MTLVYTARDVQRHCNLLMFINTCDASIAYLVCSQWNDATLSICGRSMVGAMCNSRSTVYSTLEDVYGTFVLGSAVVLGAGVLEYERTKSTILLPVVLSDFSPRSRSTF